MRWLYSITDSMDVCLSKLREIVKDRELACCSPWGRRVGYDLVTEQQQITTVLRLRNPALNRSIQAHFACGICWTVHLSMPSLL